MAVIAGIDEAGLGPILGPLVVSGVAFRVPDDRPDICLWEALSATCARSTSAGKRRLVIADSKQLHKPGHGVSGLERPALVMQSAGFGPVGRFRELLGRVAPHMVDDLDRHSWYAGCDPVLPVSRDLGDIGTRANALRANLRDAGVELLGVFCEPLLEGPYNRLVDRTRNKATVVMGLALRVADRILRAAGDDHVRLCADRLGGRTHYRQPLADSWPQFELEILEETETRSAYRLVRSERVCRVEFQTEGEKKHFPVALASIYSKYIREVCMGMFNDYWCTAQEGLKPTAGYYTDAMRWLSDAEPAISRLGVMREELVRSR